jgi:addiction module HigA family antidote
MTTNKLLKGLKPMHPGEMLREVVLPALGRPKSEIAALLGVSRQTLYNILDEQQPVTAAMAVRLGKLCGNGAEIWLNLQRRYDLQQALKDIDVSKIPTLKTPAAAA